MKPLYAFFGHHKGATSWVNAILRQVCGELGLRFAVVHNADMFGRDLPLFIQEHRIDLLSYDNADFKYVEPLEDYRGFHVIRDPRDVTVSAYFSHLYSHPITRPERAEYREFLQTLPQDEGLLLELEGRADQFAQMNGWNYSQTNVLEVKMEELTAHPYAGMIRILDYLDLLDHSIYSTKRRAAYVFFRNLRHLEDRTRRRLSFPLYPERMPVERLLGIVWENDFKKRSGGRKPGEEDPRSHYRKGVPGDWRNHFTAAHIEYFQEHYNEVLLNLGYEDDSEWAIDIGPLVTNEEWPSVTH